MNSGMGAVQARMLEISSRFPVQGPPTPPPARTASTAPSFAGALASASVQQNRGGSSVLASTGSTTTGARPPGGSPDGGQVVTAAQRYLGVPYVWGGTDPATGLDCSGLVQQVYEDLGVTLPRVSRDQAKAGTAVSSMAQAQPGDLLAFGSPVDHIGIYAGDGKMIIAPRRGDVVKVQDVYRTPSAIRRILPDPTDAAASTIGAAGARTPAVGAAGTAAAGTGAAGTQPYAALFASGGAQHGVSPALLAAVARAESGFNPSARSPAGAQGLMQFMPATAREMGVDPWDPASAVDGAARLLKRHLQEFGSTELALAAYNAGPGAVRRHGGIPPYAETQNYVRKISAQLQGA